MAGPWGYLAIAGQPLGTVTPRGLWAHFCLTRTRGGLLRESCSRVRSEGAFDCRRSRCSGRSPGGHVRVSGMQSVHEFVFEGT
jgi:hypothetical protein